MTGSVFIASDLCCLCSNKASMEVESNPIRDDAGTIIATKRVAVIKISNYFTIFGEMKLDDAMDCVFKFDEPNEMQSFVANVHGISKEMLILNLTAKSLRTSEILDKVKHNIKNKYHGS